MDGEEAGKRKRKGFGRSEWGECGRKAEKREIGWKGKEEEGKRGEDKRKVGMPTKVERLARERSNSLPIVDLFKRGEKRKEREEEKKDREKAEAFKRNTKVERSPVRKKEEGWNVVLKEVR